MIIAATTSPASPSPPRATRIRSGRTAMSEPFRLMKFVSPMKSATKRVAGES
jgi:hypothetical protein